MRTSGGREIQIISQSDKDMLATALVQLVARHVPAVITVEQALPLIHDVYSVYEPTWGPGAPLPDAGIDARTLTMSSAFFLAGASACSALVLAVSALLVAVSALLVAVVMARRRWD